MSKWMSSMVGLRSTNMTMSRGKGIPRSTVACTYLLKVSVKGDLPCGQPGQSLWADGHSGDVNSSRECAKRHLQPCSHSPRSSTSHSSTYFGLPSAVSSLTAGPLPVAIFRAAHPAAVVCPSLLTRRCHRALAAEGPLPSHESAPSPSQEAELAAAAEGPLPSHEPAISQEAELAAAAEGPLPSHEPAP